MDWMDYKKLLDEQFKLDIELDDYRDEWIRVNSDDPDSQVYSGRLTTAPQRPKPSFIGSCKKRYTPLRKRFLTTKRNASLKEKTLKEKP